MRRITIIGEAAKRIPDAVKVRYAETPWRAITGMRDKLIHEYSGIHIDRVWKVVRDDIAPLKQTIERMLKELS